MKLPPLPELKLMDAFYTKGQINDYGRACALAALEAAAKMFDGKRLVDGQGVADEIRKLMEEL